MQNKIIRFLTLFVTVSLVLTIGSQKGMPPFTRGAGAQSTGKLPEGRDFSTDRLGDAWDMAEYTDISQYINQSGQVNLLEEISVAGGVFSARATALKQASFHLLFPGYLNALLIGKVGRFYPIDVNTYKCLYVAAKVDSGPPENGSPDQMVVYWFADEYLNLGTWGQTLPGIVLYPEATNGIPIPRWKLYNLRLDQARVPAGFTRWENAPGGKWRGLRIDATLQQTSFQIDWVRLTDCNAVNLTIQRNSTAPVSLSIQPDGTNREILMIANTTDNPITLDTQGLQSGKYTYLIKSGDQVVARGNFEINQAPIATFNRPSFTSGVDYATQAGNPWDMGDEADIVSAQCMSTSMTNGLFVMDTLSVESQPANCVGGVVADPVIFLNSPQPADTTQFRYLTIRLNTAGPWQNVPHGMINRWVWYMGDNSGQAGSRCVLVSYGIPYDVGWQTYTVDLHDPIDGIPQQAVGDRCPNDIHWLATTPALRFRFDPNENIMGQTIHQELDWIRLAKMDEVNRGIPFPIRISLNMPWSEITSIGLYYTDDLGNPYQHPVEQVLEKGSLSLQRIEKSYLPVILVHPAEVAPSPNETTFMWDTNPVLTGEYYVCLKVSDDKNTATYCSAAPVRVK